MSAALPVSRRSALAGLSGVVAALALGRVPLVSAPAVSAAAGISPLAAAANSLGARLAAAAGQTNTIISPASIYAALGMAALGADADSQRVLREQGLLAGASVEAALDDARALARDLAETGDGNTLTAAQGAWVPKGAAIEPAFARNVERGYAAPVTAVDFADPATLSVINAWIKERTAGAIPSMLERLDARTEFLLASTLHFRGTWATAFDPGLTRPMPFATAAGPIEIPTMHGTVPGGYWQRSGLHGATLPYRGGHLVMRIATSLPDASPSASLPKGALESLIEPVAETPAALELRLPKFKAGVTLDLEKPLTASGLGRLYAPETRFDGITGVAISRPVVMHRSVMEVDEIGTEAAAATTVAGSRSLAPPTVAFPVDRPFALSITHVPTGLALFLAVIGNPAASGIA